MAVGAAFAWAGPGSRRNEISACAGFDLWQVRIGWAAFTYGVPHPDLLDVVRPFFLQNRRRTPLVKVRCYDETKDPARRHERAFVPGRQGE